MRFLVDAQLPRRLARHLVALGHDTIHTLDLPGKNTTTDATVSEVADAQGRVVVTKDSDFASAHVLRGSPQRLLMVETGNIPNEELERLFTAHLGQIVLALENTSWAAISRSGLSIRG